MPLKANFKNLSKFSFVNERRLQVKISLTWLKDLSTSAELTGPRRITKTFCAKFGKRSSLFFQNCSGLLQVDSLAIIHFCFKDSSILSVDLIEANPGDKRMQYYGSKLRTTLRK